MNNGWIKLHRQFLEWEWYGCPNVTALFIHCILKANHKKKNWRGNSIPRGTFITSYNSLSEETGLSIQQLRTAFKKLESTGEINKRTTSVNSWITVVNYDEYQDTNKPSTKEQQTTNKGATTTKNEKNIKNEKKYTIMSGSKWNDEYIDFTSFTDKFNELYDRQLRITESKRKNIRSRLQTFTGKEILQAWENRLDDEWLTSEGSEYLGNWKAAMRNDEKIDKYLTKVNNNGKHKVIEEATSALERIDWEN